MAYQSPGTVVDRSSSCGLYVPRRWCSFAVARRGKEPGARRIASPSAATALRYIRDRFRPLTVPSLLADGVEGLDAR